MIETKVESQNYLADPYNSSLGHLPFDANQYVISAINFLFFSFPLHSPPPLHFSFRLRFVRTCHLSNGHERGVIQWLEATLRPRLLFGLDWIVLFTHPRFINSPFPIHPSIRSALMPVNTIAD